MLHGKWSWSNGYIENPLAFWLSEWSSAMTWLKYQPGLLCQAPQCCRSSHQDPLRAPAAKWARWPFYESVLLLGAAVTHKWHKSLLNTKHVHIFFATWRNFLYKLRSKWLSKMPLTICWSITWLYVRLAKLKLLVSRRAHSSQVLSQCPGGKLWVQRSIPELHFWLSETF